jgi:hypothetical protein
MSTAVDTLSMQRMMQKKIQTAAMSAARRHMARQMTKRQRMMRTAGDVITERESRRSVKLSALAAAAEAAVTEAHCIMEGKKVSEKAMRQARKPINGGRSREASSYSSSSNGSDPESEGEAEAELGDSQVSVQGAAQAEGISQGRSSSEAMGSFQGHPPSVRMGSLQGQTSSALMGSPQIEAMDMIPGMPSMYLPLAQRLGVATIGGELTRYGERWMEHEQARSARRKVALEERMRRKRMVTASISARTLMRQQAENMQVERRRIMARPQLDPGMMAGYPMDAQEQMEAEQRREQERPEEEQRMEKEQVEENVAAIPLSSRGRRRAMQIAAKRAALASLQVGDMVGLGLLGVSSKHEALANAAVKAAMEVLEASHAEKRLRQKAMVGTSVEDPTERKRRRREKARKAAGNARKFAGGTTKHAMKNEELREMAIEAVKAAWTIL